MISITDKILCCGCGGCVQSCPHDCIKMDADDEGFLYPEVETQKCVNCGICERVCPIIGADSNHSRFIGQGEVKAVGGWHKDGLVRSRSSSGGAFSLFAEHVIHNKGIVYGCTLDSNMSAYHVGVETIEELELLRGSKYVQSDINNVYIEIKKNLSLKRMVLFVGTPCQCAGLYSFLGNKPDNLYIIDFICHGVPSPMIFKEYIDALGNKEGSPVKEYRFRNKDKGWSQSGMQLGTLIKFDNEKTIRNYPAFKDNFMNGFLDDSYLRPSCYDCRFKEIQKLYSDFTIGDFWGVDKVAPLLNDKKGTSLILINTDKGKSLWEEVKDSFAFKEVSLNAAISHNPPLLKSALRYPRRDTFFNDYHNKGYGYVERKYMSALKWAWHRGLKVLSKASQFIKFGIVGVSNTVINLLVYYGLIYLGFHYLPAYTCGFIVSVCNAFYWNNKYVFKNKKETSLVKAFIKVFISYGMSFLLSIVIMSLLIEVFSVSKWLAPILKLIVTIPLNFVLNKLWAFKDGLETK